MRPFPVLRGRKSGYAPVEMTIFCLRTLAIVSKLICHLDRRSHGPAGPPKVMKTSRIRPPLSSNRHPFLCHPERSRGICSSADPSWECFSTELSWACGPPKVMKNASVQHPLSMQPLPFPCHPDRSEAERRDPRFRGPFLEVFFDRVAQWRDLRCLFSSRAGWSRR
jgi:hypothetical protein